MIGKRPLQIILLVISFSVALYLGIGWFQYRADHVVENDSRITTDSIAISSRIAGWVTEVPVSEGDYLSDHSLIARVDQREENLELEKLNSKLSELHAEKSTLSSQKEFVTKQLEQRIKMQSYQVDAVASGVRAADAQVRYKLSELNRIRSLARQRIASPSKLEKAEIEFQKAQSSKATALAQLQATKARLQEINAERGRISILEHRQREIDVKRETLTTQIQQQMLRIRDHVIKSPINAVVDKVFVDPGEYVRKGQRIALIHDPQNIWVETNIRETELRLVKVGATVKIEVDAYPNKPFKGKVLRLGSSATSQFALLPSPNPSGNFTKISQRIPVKISIESVEGKPLRPGMMVEVEIVIARPQ